MRMTWLWSNPLVVLRSDVDHDDQRDEEEAHQDQPEEHPATGEPAHLAAEELHPLASVGSLGSPGPRPSVSSRKTVSRSTASVRSSLR